MFSHLPGNMGEHLMLTLLKFHPKHGVRQRLEDFGHNFYRLFLRHTATEAITPLLANFG